MGRRTSWWATTLALLCVGLHGRWVVGWPAQQVVPAEERLPGWLGETHAGFTVGGWAKTSGGALRGRGADVADADEDPDADLDEGQGDGLPALNSLHTDPSRIVHLSWNPRAYLYKGFLRKAECDYIVEHARPKLEKSTVVDSQTGKSVGSNIRTSDGMFFNRGHDDVIADIERRIAEWTHVPIENGEGIQVLRYKVGQKYEQHMDSFNDKFNTGDDKGGQRVATVLMYLSDVEEGGETVFPNTVERPHAKDPAWSRCAQKGVAVKARKGDALLFFSLDNIQHDDMKSMHAGCPVIKGEKWSATKWMHVGSFEVGHHLKFGPGICDDENDMCKEWAKTGECDKNPGYMRGQDNNDGYCMRSCGVCKPGTKPKPKTPG